MSEFTPSVESRFDHFNQPLRSQAASPDGHDSPGESSLGTHGPHLRLHEPDANETGHATPASGPEPLPAVIVDRILKAAHRLRGLLSGHFAEFELSDVRYSVLRLLHDSEPGECTQAQLAESLDQSESSISTLVKRMRNSGLLYRLRSTVDKRKWALKLTESGRQQLASVQQCHAERMSELLNGFDVAEQKTLAELLNRLIVELVPSEDAADSGEASDAATPETAASHLPAAEWNSSPGTPAA